MSEKEALKEAEKISEKYSIVIHVIKSEEIYYIDISAITGGWEILVATFENGRRIN